MSYDQGGYFIIKGKEKVTLQETKVNNILYITKSPEDNVVLEGKLKYVSRERISII